MSTGHWILHTLCVGAHLLCVGAGPLLVWGVLPYWRPLLACLTLPCEHLCPSSCCCCCCCCQGPTPHTTLPPPLLGVLSRSLGGGLGSGLGSSYPFSFPFAAPLSSLEELLGVNPGDALWRPQLLVLTTHRILAVGVTPPLLCPHPQRHHHNPTLEEEDEDDEDEDDEEFLLPPYDRHPPRREMGHRPQLNPRARSRPRPAVDPASAWSFGAQYVRCRSWPITRCTFYLEMGASHSQARLWASPMPPEDLFWVNPTVRTAQSRSSRERNGGQVQNMSPSLANGGEGVGRDGSRRRRQQDMSSPNSSASSTPSAEFFPLLPPSAAAAELASMDSSSSTLSSRSSLWEHGPRARPFFRVGTVVGAGDVAELEDCLSVWASWALEDKEGPEADGSSMEMCTRKFLRRMRQHLTRQLLYSWILLCASTLCGGLLVWLHSTAHLWLNTLLWSLLLSTAGRGVELRSRSSHKLQSLRRGDVRVYMT